MENLFLVVVLAGLGFGVWSLSLKKKKSTTSSINAGGTWSGNTPDKSDGSVTPPKPEGENVE